MPGIIKTRCACETEQEEARWLRRVVRTITEMRKGMQSADASLH